MYTPANPKGYLLDVGCGGGAFLKRLTESGWQAEGIDFDPAAVEHARSKGLHVRLGSLEEQRYPDNHFDAITMSHVIEHIHEPLRLLQECHRILKPKGYLVIATPNSRSWGHKLYKACWMPLDPPRHLQLFSPQSLLHLAEESGFTVLKMQTTIRNANNIMLVSQSIKNTGKYVWGTPRPLGLRMWTLGLQLLESVLLRLKPDIGEEIMLISCK
jgi:2-polyprenyl-3-methyl-5-hydroxy-6-metoxy-1,4-benzoquinol methylase